MVRDWESGRSRGLEAEALREGVCQSGSEKMRVAVYCESGRVERQRERECEWEGDGMEFEKWEQGEEGDGQSGRRLQMGVGRRVFKLKIQNRARVTLLT